MELSREELLVTIEAINHSIAYRLNNRTRMSEIKSLRQAKKKLEEKLSKTKLKTSEQEKKNGIKTNVRNP